MAQQLLYREFSLAGNAQEFLVRNQIVYTPTFPHSQFSSSNLRIHDYPIKPSPAYEAYLNGTEPPDRGILRENNE